MKYHIEIENVDDLDLLKQDVLLAAIEAMTNMSYSSGVASLINQSMKRETDQTLIRQMARDLFEGIERLSEENRKPVIVPFSGVPAESQPTPRRTITVRSDSRPGHQHFITLEGQRAVECTCESFLYKNKNNVGTPIPCKHIMRFHRHEL